MGILRLDHNDVNDRLTFADYCRQELGIKRPLSKEWKFVNTELKKFWAMHPNATWGTLTRAVAVMKKWKGSRCDNLGSLVKVANRMVHEGDITVAEPVETDLDTAILDACAKETDKNWRYALYGARGDVQQALLDRWRAEREPLL